MTRLLEVCVDDADGLAAAVSGGADRIELCSSLDLGGLTPSQSLMQAAARLPIPAYAMVRPRAGDFVFSPADIALMLADIDAIRAAGLAGVVLGANLLTGELDEPLLRQLAHRASGLGMTLHRAMDLVPEITPAVDFAVAEGFERILTSGGAPTALAGAKTLRETFDAAAGRIAIMPGSGINAENLAQVLAIAPFPEIHASCSAHIPGIGGKTEELGFAGPTRRVTSADKVRALKAAVIG